MTHIETGTYSQRMSQLHPGYSSRDSRVTPRPNNGKPKPAVSAGNYIPRRALLVLET